MEKLRINGKNYKI